MPLINACTWGEMAHVAIKAPVWLRGFLLTSPMPLLPSHPLPSQLLPKTCSESTPKYECCPGVLLCYLFAGTACQSGSFPQSRTGANRKAHKHTAPLQRSAPELPDPATHLPLLRARVPLHPHTPGKNYSQHG